MSFNGIKMMTTRGISICACLAILCSVIGCGKEQNNELSSSVIEETPVEKINETTSSKIDDEGKPIWDFDEYVNGAWLKEQGNKNIGNVCAWDEAYDRVNTDIDDIMNNTNLDEISEDEGLYKAIFFYRQMLDTSDARKRLETTKRYLDVIDSIENIEELYALYSDPEYDVLNGLLNFCVIPDDYGCNTLYFWPQSLIKSLQENDQIVSFMADLGYSDQRSHEIVENAMIVAKMVEDYWNDSAMNEGVGYYSQGKLDEAGVSVPVIPILEELNSFGRYKEVLAGGDFCNFLNKTFQTQNIAALRDHFLVCAMYRLLAVADNEESWAEVGTDYTELALSVTLDFGGDAINEEYMRRHLPDQNVELAKELTEEVKDSISDAIDEMQWLSDNGKELAKQKMMIMRESYGGNQAENDLDDVRLTDDVVENYISFLISQNNFYRIQTRKEDDDRELFNENLFELNAHYNRKYSILSVTSTILCDEKCSENVRFEERVGYMGFLIAHEVAHSYDSSGILYDYRGYYSPWMTEEETKEYGQVLQRITEFFDGKEIAYDQKIDGKLISDETFADIVAMDCCLRILQKHDNPDYDLFFKTLAKWNAYYYTENGIQKAVADTHLPAKERINYVFGQFDKFYEIYDIDENSPYFVPVKERLSNML